MPTNPVTGYADTDKTVMDVVLRSMRLPERPDFTFVNLQQIDSAGHASGTGPAYDAAIGMADTEIQRLVDELRRRGEWERTVLVDAALAPLRIGCQPTEADRRPLDDIR